MSPTKRKRTAHDAGENEAGDLGRSRHSQAQNVERRHSILEQGSSARPSRTARRRAATACQLCRIRKTKCDNKKPNCGYCNFNGATCVYTDDDGDSRSIDPTFGVSNAVLLERLNLVVDLLHGQQSTHSTAQTATYDAQTLPPPPTALPSLDPREATNSAFSDSGFGQLEVSEAAARSSACESLLRWPILRDDVGDHQLVTSYPLQTSVDIDGESGLYDTKRRPALQEDRVWPLLQKFLALIHVKNPVLDASKLRQYGRHCIEYGPGWDGPGCLVLLACALACLATPYAPANIIDQQEQNTRDNLDSDDFSAGEVFFDAAKRRLGTVSNCLIAVQCYYFAGLYEKFAVRPFAAWLLLQQACVQAQAFLYAKALTSQHVSRSISIGGRARHIEQRLYWSCVKAECELRADLQLPSSGLLHFKYPDLFPFLSLPSASTDGAATAAMAPSPIDVESPMSHASPSDGSLRPEEQRSWLLYLAEISLCKIMNRILAGLYNRGERYWVHDFGETLAQHAAFSEELALWRTNLPPPIRFPDTGMPQNEMAFFLQTRYISSLEWIHRPFLYHVCHEPESVHMSQALPLASAELGLCAALIPMVMQHHRHGGVWALLRKSFSCSLSLIAGENAATRLEAVRGGGSPRLMLPQQPTELVKQSIETIRKWEDRAEDLVQMRRLLEDIVANK